MNNSLKPQKKQTNKLYLCTIQDNLGKIQKVLTHSSFEQLWLLGSTESKSMGGYYTLFDLKDGTWRFVDGNYKANNLNIR